MHGKTVGHHDSDTCLGQPASVARADWSCRFGPARMRAVWIGWPSQSLFFFSIRFYFYYFSRFFFIKCFWTPNWLKQLFANFSKPKYYLRIL
jgi:hypothetical protein